MAAAAHFLIRKKLFNSKYPQLQIAKDFAVAEKKLHLTASGRKYDLGKKAPHKRTASGNIPTPTKMSTQEKEQQHTQGDTITETAEDSQTPEASQMSEPEDDDDESLQDPFAPSKTFSTKDLKATPKPCHRP